MAPLIVALIKAAPTIIMALVTLAEILFADVPKSGEQKKDFVLQTFQAFAETATGIFTGGAAETWDRIRESVGVIIDASAQIAFPHEPGDVNAMGEGY